MKVARNGQVTIPKDFRDLLDIHEGDEVVFVFDRDKRSLILWKPEKESEDGVQ